MDFNSVTTLPKQNQHPSKPNNRRLTLDQVRLLETSFKSNPKLQAEHKLELASKLDISPRQVAIWFQNRRARQKTEAIELDYRTIQLQLDNVLVEKRRLETEVGVLKHELYKAQQILLASSSHSPADSIPSVSVSGEDEHASSSSIKNNNSYGPESAQGLQVEDLYSCLSYWP